MVGKVTKTMKVGRATVSVNMGAGNSGGMRRGVAAPSSLTHNAPVKSQTPGIPKLP